VTNIEVFFQVPSTLESGLISGSLERIGGIVRDTSSKQIVAWLREGNLPAPEDLTKSLGYATQSLAMVSGTGLALNLALTSASLVVIMSRIDRLSDQIDDLQTEMISQFQRDRDIRFKSALQAARDALESDNPITKDQRLNQSRDKLDEAEMHFKEEFENALDKGLLPLAQHYLTRAMYAATSLARTYLETEDFKIARRRLDENIAAYDKLTRRMILGWLGKSPATYLHKGVSSDDVYRFTRVIDWLYEPEQKSVLDVIINELRTDFWNDGLIEPGEDTLLLNVASPFRRIRGGISPKFEDFLKQVPSNLMNMEVAIENLQRLIGFQIEMRSLRLMRDQSENWEKLMSEREIFTVLVADEALQLGK
jgi:hypothetical protein